MSTFEKIQIIMALGALFGLVHLLRIREKWAMILTGLYVLSIGLNFVESDIVKLDAYYLFTVLCVACGFYAFSMPDFTNEKRFILLTIAILSTLPNIFILARWPVLLPGFLTIVPIGLFVYIMIKKREEYKNETGFLVIQIVNSLISFFLVSTVFIS